MISFIVACYNCENFLRDSVASALAQQDVEVEVLIVDDCSTDQSYALAMSLAETDSRVRCFRTTSNGGPAKARNIGLREARGEWVAILDSDDLVKPDRSKFLIANALENKANIVCDNLIIFSDADKKNNNLFIDQDLFSPLYSITLEAYLRQTVMYSKNPNFGFLKPVFSRDFLLENSIIYNENLIIGEDDDLILRALIAGAIYKFLYKPFYLYRKHGHSISHRLSSQHADLMLAAAQEFEPKMRLQPPEVQRAWRKRRRSIERATTFAHMIDALKEKKFIKFLQLGIRRPLALGLFRLPIMAKLSRFSTMWKRIGRVKTL